MWYVNLFIDVSTQKSFSLLCAGYCEPLNKYTHFPGEVDLLSKKKKDLILKDELYAELDAQRKGC
jgi:hypothetical protein